MYTENLIYKNNNIIKWKPISFINYIISQEPSKEINFLISRLEGETLQEIASKNNITRERVRQVVKKVLNNLPVFYEDKYQNIFEKYLFNYESFSIIFNEPKIIFYYLNLKYISGDLDIQEGLKDKTLDLEIRKNIEKFIYKNHIYIDNKKIEPTSDSIFSYILETFFKEQGHIENFFNIYTNLIRIYELNSEELNIGIRSIEGRFTRRDDIISSIKKSIRYYPLHDYDFEPITNLITQGSYKDLEFSTLKIFEEHSLLMKDFNILDEYELHNLLKKLDDTYENIHIEFGRMPMITIGNGNRSDQILELLINKAPISADNLALAYREIYGVLEPTVKANFLNDFEEYLHDGIYDIERPSLEPFEIEILKNLITDGFYSLNQIKNIYKNNIPESYKSEKINPYSLKLLGYNVYPTYAIKDEFNNITDYVKHVFEKEEINIKNINPELFNNQSFQAELYSRKKSLEIIDINPSEFVNLKFLNKKEISYSDLINYCNEIYNFIDEETIFTIHFLKKLGFYNKLHDFNFSDWFYSSILSSDTRFANRRISSTRLFKKESDNIVYSMLLENILSDNKSFYISDLIIFLKEDYNIIVTESNLKVQLGKTFLYIDHLNNIVFLNEELYFKQP